MISSNIDVEQTQFTIEGDIETIIGIMCQYSKENLHWLLS